MPEAIRLYMISNSQYRRIYIIDQEGISKGVGGAGVPKFEMHAPPEFWR
jgi:hypothetical protein